MSPVDSAAFIAAQHAQAFAALVVDHAGVAREREFGTLRILLAQGVGSRQIVLGKLLALSGFARLVRLPALLPLAWIGVSGHAPWLLLWALIVLLASSLFGRNCDALLTLLAVWAVLVILLPRVVPDLANNAIALPTRVEDEIHIGREYLALRDAHNPDDPKFAQFRDPILKEYGVERIGDLPVNFKGLVGMEGEHQSSELFNRYALAAFELQARQNQLVDDCSQHRSGELPAFSGTRRAVPLRPGAGSEPLAGRSFALCGRQRSRQGKPHLAHALAGLPRVPL